MAAVMPGGSGADDGEVDVFGGADSPDAGALGEIAEGWIDQHAVVGGFDDGGYFRVVQSIQNCFARVVGGIVPGEGNEVFEEEFADHRCLAAFAGADDFHADCAGVHVPTAALHAGDKELFAEDGDFGE
jgi:hypothetical protein